MLLSLLLLLPFANSQGTSDAYQTLLPKGLPDGTVITFYFNYVEGSNGDTSVEFNFYEVKDVQLGEAVDAPVHIRARLDGVAIVSATYKDGKYIEEQKSNPDNFEEPAIEERPWRFDFVKLSSKELLIFFMGFLVQARKFPMSLDNVRSIYLLGNDHVKDPVARTYTPNDQLPPINSLAFWNYREDYSDRVVAEFASFPVNSKILMIAFIPSSDTFRDRSEIRYYYVGLRPKGKRFWPVAISQARKDSDIASSRLWLHDRNVDGSSLNSKDCYEGYGVSDLEHILLERKEDHIRVEVFFINGDSKVCPELHGDFNILDGPVELVVDGGAMVFYMEASVPRVIQPDNHALF